MVLSLSISDNICMQQDIWFQEHLFSWFISHLNHSSSAWPKRVALLSNIQGAGSREWREAWRDWNTNQFAGASGLRGRCEEGGNLGRLVLHSPIFQMGTESFHYHDLKWLSLFGEFFYKLALLFAPQICVGFIEHLLYDRLCFLILQMESMEAAT